MPRRTPNAPTVARDRIAARIEAEAGGNRPCTYAGLSRATDGAVSAIALWKIVHQDRHVSVDEAIAIARALDTALPELLGVSA